MINQLQEPTWACLLFEVAIVIVLGCHEMYIMCIKNGK